MQLVQCEQNHRAISVFVNNSYTDVITLNSKQSRQNTQATESQKARKKQNSEKKKTCITLSEQNKYSKSLAKVVKYFNKVCPASFLDHR